MGISFFLDTSSIFIRLKALNASESWLSCYKLLNIKLKVVTYLISSCGHKQNIFWVRNFILRLVFFFVTQVQHFWLAEDSQNAASY